MSDLVKRAEATTATKAEFAGAIFDWKQVDCYRVARAHLARFGHVLPEPRYSTAMGAYRQMKRQGFDSLDDLISSYLPPIAPAMMLIGDLAIADGPDPFGGGLLICAGNKLIGFYEGEDVMVNIIVETPPRGAWRA